MPNYRKVLTPTLEITYESDTAGGPESVTFKRRTIEGGPVTLGFVFSASEWTAFTTMGPALHRATATPYTPGQRDAVPPCTTGGGPHTHRPGGKA